MSRGPKIVAESDRLLGLLRAVREIGPPDAFVGAGAVRDLVWDHLTGGASSRPDADVDVVYFDPDEQEDRSEDYARALAEARPDVAWDVVNQAFVHAWHRQAGREVAPLASLESGLATWPETATAVAVQLSASGNLRILAPFGLDASDPAFWQKGLGVISGMIDELEAMEG